MIRRCLLIAGWALVLGLSAFAQSPPPSPSEQALQEKLTLDDGKPTQQGSAQPSEPSVFRALGSLVLVLGLVGGGLYALRKYGAKRIPGSGGTRLAVEERLALGERRFVAILRADDEHFLIAMTPQGISSLGRLHGAPPFDAALENQEALPEPVPVREFERMVRGEKP